MLKAISEFPVDKKIAGIHSVPVTHEGLLCMVWDVNEKVLTTVGGRRETGETLVQTLDRETTEEAGLILATERIPIASWYWESTDTYTVFVTARIAKYVEIPSGFETSGRVLFNFETARKMIREIEGDVPRIKILDLAEQASQYLNIG